MNAYPITPDASKPHASFSSIKRYKLFPSSRVIKEDTGKVIFTLVHEIRNPLTNIALATEILQGMVMTETQKVYLDIIMRSSERIRDTVTDLLNSSARTQVAPEKHSVQYLIDEVLIANEDRCMLKNITVRKNYASQDFKMLFNRAKMKIALANIIVNAIEAMPAKDGVLEISTGLVDGACTLLIKDNGTGISEENLQNIFTPYFTSKPRGIGLGLSGALDILRSNDVQVNVESKLGQGTRFILSFSKELK